MTRFIAIASGKGGTGKTTTSINLGIALSNLGLKVLVVDGNISQPNVRLHLGFPQSAQGLNDVLAGDRKIEEIIYQHPSGIGVIPGNGAILLEGDVSKDMGSAMLSLVGSADVVLIDTGAGLGNEVTSVLKSADETLIVTNPDHASINEAARTAAIAEELGSVVAGIVLNKVTGKNHDVPLAQVKSAINKPIISIIPEDKSVRESLLMKKAVIHTHPHSPASVEFRKLAYVLKND